MALNARQKVIYRDTCLIYKPTNTSGTSSIGAVKEPLYELVVQTAGSMMKYDPNKETTILGSFGRLMSGAKSELEMMYFDAAQVLHDQYCIKLTTTGHPLINTWFTVIGEPEVRANSGARISNYTHVNVRSRINAPTIRP